MVNKYYWFSKFRDEVRVIQHKTYKKQEKELERTVAAKVKAAPADSSSQLPN